MDGHLHTIDEIYDIVKSKLSEYRFHHSECVSKRCVELAEKYKVELIEVLTGFKYIGEQIMYMMHWLHIEKKES